jgi:multiple sugar transport system substrate-binding protein
LFCVMPMVSIPARRCWTGQLRRILARAWRSDLHGDGWNLKRQFEQIVGTDIHQRAFSIDRLREEALRNAERKRSRYDIIAVDLPWIGEFVEKGVLRPLDRGDGSRPARPRRFPHRRLAGGALGRRPYGVPSQTTPELLFYRRDWFAEAGLEPPATTDA